MISGGGRVVSTWDVVAETESTSHPTSCLSRHGLVLEYIIYKIKKQRKKLTYWDKLLDWKGVNNTIIELREKLPFLVLQCNVHPYLE